MMARRWHLSKSERVRSGRTCRHCPNSALPEKNNTWSFAPRNGFSQNVTSANVPAGLTLWPLTTVRGGRQWYGCTKTLSALKCEGLTGTSSRRRQKRYNLDSSACASHVGRAETVRGGLLCRSCGRTRSRADG